MFEANGKNGYKNLKGWKINGKDGGSSSDSDCQVGPSIHQNLGYNE